MTPSVHCTILSVHCPLGAKHDYELRTTMAAATPVKSLLQQYKKNCPVICRSKLTCLNLSGDLQ